MAFRELTWTEIFRMSLTKYSVLLILILCNLIILSEQTNEEKTTEFQFFKPTIFVAVLVRNKAHTLPWFFGHLERLNYPKDRIAIW